MTRIYRCQYKGRSDSKMFTEGKEYPVIGTQGKTDIIRDDLGHARHLLWWNPRFATGQKESLMEEAPGFLGATVYAHFQIVGHEVNMAENQYLWDEGRIGLEGCRRKGAEHAAYGWSRRGLGFPGTQEQIDAYNEGYDWAMKVSTEGAT